MGQKVLLPIILLLAIGAVIHSGLQWKTAGQFQAWTHLHQKTYSLDQYTYRMGIFKQTSKEVAEHNARYQQGLQSYYTAVNAFADLTDEEFSAMYLDRQMQTKSAFACTGPQPPQKNLPDAFDWAAKSAVTSIRSQGGSCISGYAIAAAESIESGRFITTSILKPLSPQQILDCSKTQGNQGCKGGNILNSFEYIKRGGISLESSIPYQGADRQCSYNLGKKEWEILGCVAVTSKSEEAIKAAIFHQPVAASINGAKLKTYSGGVYESGFASSCKTAPDTWMLMVGYGKDGKKNFWKLKNSWGTAWGSQGYLYIVRKGDGEGECGVQNELFYPLD